MKKFLKNLLAIVLLFATIDLFIWSGGVNIFKLPYFAGQPETLGIVPEDSGTGGIAWEDMEVTGEEKVDDGEPYEKVEVTGAEADKYDEYLSECFAYRTLDAEMKKAYIEVFAAMIKHEETVDMSVLDIDKLHLAFQCVMIDHPEIFYAEGYSYSQYTRGDQVTRLTFTPTYICTEEEAEMLEEEMEKVISEILSGVSKDADDYTKVKYVYEYLVHSTEYDMSAPDNQNICSVFLNNRSVCQGYSKATQLLLNRMGVECTLVTGVVNTTEGHSWNLVKMDGDYYHLDTTWGDASYQSIEGEDEEWLRNLDIVNYDYFGVSTSEIQKTHVIDNPIELPNCTASACNYYVREGCLLSGPDKDKLGSILSAHPIVRDGSTIVKCTDRLTYDWLMNYLITESRVFDYVESGGGSIGYAQNEDALSLTLWLDD